MAAVMMSTVAVAVTVTMTVMMANIIRAAVVQNGITVGTPVGNGFQLRLGLGLKCCGCNTDT